MNNENIYRIKFKCSIPPQYGNCCLPQYGNCCLHFKMHPFIVQCIMLNITIYVEYVYLKKSFKLGFFPNSSLI